ncbi:hypothetical protein GOBAR_AA27908 [Gossypium barbadense]|uniref:RecA family profile 1 domain-containing protein n=1 Tax=Gossypium barbadense TaxID=3634 RepID=A0A2P5WNT5_GOSBA|nr:hypothetical protein GOBAR_AA27908 [Gossypium barbadense]
MGSHAKAWLVEDESAREMLDRVLTERPFLLLPPLHRVPLRVGNVVELVGPSSSSKTHILIQAAITCILPKLWKGVSYGGLGHSAMFIDLDCRFDVLRFSELLNHRIMEAANGSSSKVGCHQKDSEAQFERMKPYNEELFALCMKRFLYIRCYDSSEFLATLKTLHYRLQKEREVHGVNVHLLLIDRNYRKWSAVDNPYSRNITSDQQLPYREYMPAAWQSFVTHRILVRATDDDLVNGEHQNNSIYLLKWLLPPLNSLDKFTVRDTGVFILS